MCLHLRDTVLGRRDAQESFPVFLHAFLPLSLEAASPRVHLALPSFWPRGWAKDLFLVAPVLPASDCHIDLSLEVDFLRPRLGWGQLAQKWCMT